MEIKIKPQFLYRIQNESVHDLCKNFNAEKTGIIRNNNAYPCFAGEWVQINVNDYISHFVKPAQTIEDIAKIYGISPDKIIKDNYLTSTKLFIGQLIKVK